MPRTHLLTLLQLLNRAVPCLLVMALVVVVVVLMRETWVAVLWWRAAVQEAREDGAVRDRIRGPQTQDSPEHSGSAGAS